MSINSYNNQVKKTKAKNLQAKINLLVNQLKTLKKFKKKKEKMTAK